MAGARRIPESKIEDLKGYLRRIGFKFEDRPHQVFLARYPGLAVSLYNSGKVVLSGRDGMLKREIEAFLDSLGAAREGPVRRLNLWGRVRIGTDEVGKGDYFGPLVIAGVLVDGKTEEKLKKIGVRDSKGLSDAAILKLSREIRRMVGRRRYEVIWISPLKYNALYEKLKNLNRILGWGHSRAIENLLEREECELAIADKFGDKSYIASALMEKGKKIELVQVPRAEEDVAVAAASILAREAFLKRRMEMGREYGVEFPKGSSRVLDFARGFTAAHGADALKKVAKLHFKITKKVIGEGGG